MLSFTKTKGLGLKGLTNGFFYKIGKKTFFNILLLLLLSFLFFGFSVLVTKCSFQGKDTPLLHKTATFLRGTNDETKVTAAVSERYYQQHLHSFIRKKYSTRHLAKMMGACVGEEELEGKKRVKKQRRKFSALPQKRLNIRSEAEAVEILGLNGDDYKFVCKEGTKDQVSSSFLFEKSL